MGLNFYRKCLYGLVVLFLSTTNLLSQIAPAAAAGPIVPTITGPIDPLTGLPATLGNGITTGQVYTTNAGMTGYVWVVSGPVGAITAGQGTNSITVTWTNPTGQQFVSVYFTGSTTATLIINYYPFPGAINPVSIPKFMDPLPHFAAGLRVDAKLGGDLMIKAQLTSQVALSTGTVLSTGTIGQTPGAGLGTYAAYNISKDGGQTWGIPMWPAQTIEARQGFPLKVHYVNNLSGSYDQFNILADQTLMMHGYTLTGTPETEPYTGPIPMVVHLHGGEIPSGSDGGPNAWFMPEGTTGFNMYGPTYQINQSGISTYPNMQESATLWFHPHDDGLTRINVYTGLAGYYFLRGDDEETAKLPGWSGDDKVKEITPTGKTTTFNPSNSYLPEIELGIQDRMFNVKGELYWPVAPTNPDIHPYWTPEFVGDVMVVNGKSWPYLSVAPRKYRFRILEGCNARFLNMWLADAANGKPGPVITVIGGEGGLLADPKPLDPAAGQTLLMAPGQRYDVVIDFTGLAGKTFTLMNNAAAPYPVGIPVTPGTTDRIMQFVVNGQMISAANPAVTGADKSLLPFNLRPLNPLVKLTDFAGKLSAGVTPTVKRQIILNEVISVGGPASVLVNNSYYDALLAIPGTPNVAGGPSEVMAEGTTETVQIINVSADAHPIHIHLLQWQLVSRQKIDDIKYLAAYAAAWTAIGGTSFPLGQGYPGGSGPPAPYDVKNADGAIGGNPPITPYLKGQVMPAKPEEMGWKDNIMVMPGEVTTFVVRVAPTDKPVNTPVSKLLFPFDPAEGPGYVWHCHIVDHEDMSMMRPLMFTAGSRPQSITIDVQPADKQACTGDIATLSVNATSAYLISYQWQYSADKTNWAALDEVPPYSGTKTRSLSVNTAGFPTAGFYRCILDNGKVNTSVITNPASLTLVDCSVSGTLTYNNGTFDPLQNFTVTIDGKSGLTDATGAFSVSNVTSGIHPVTVTTTVPPDGINSTDAGSVNAWVAAPLAIPHVKYLAGDVDNSTLITSLDAQAIQNNFVRGTPFAKEKWVYWNPSNMGTLVNPVPLTVSVNGASVNGANILGMSTGDFNGSYKPSISSTSKVLLNSSGTVLTVAAGKQFNLPLIAAAPMQVRSVSLILNVPAAMVTVNGVSIQGSAVPVTWGIKGDVLTIGWNSSIPVSVNAGSPIVVLSMTPTIAFTTSSLPMTIGMVNSYLNEMADRTFTTIPNATLRADAVAISGSSASSLKLTATPNPTTGLTTITYVLPLAGTVNLSLFDSGGSPISNPVNGVNQPIGTYTVPLNMTGKLAGSYYLKITLVSGPKTLTNTIIIVKQY